MPMFVFDTDQAVKHAHEARVSEAKSRAMLENGPDAIGDQAAGAT